MSNKKSTRRKRVKKFTKEYNRKLKKAEESTRELKRVKAESKAILSDLLSLIPISQQTIDYSDAGLVANIKTDIPSDKYIALLRRLSKLND